MAGSSMQPDKSRADAPARWLDNAGADLALARAGLPPGGLYEHLCFHAQQAAEKSLKAVLLHLGVNPPFTHDLQTLLTLLMPRLVVPPDLADSVELNPYAVVTRYPGETEPVDEDEYEEALHLAERVFTWAESVVNAGS